MTLNDPEWLIYVKFYFFCAGMSIALKPDFRSLAITKLVVNIAISANFKPQRTAAASRGVLAIAFVTINPNKTSGEAYPGLRREG